MEVLHQSVGRHKHRLLLRVGLSILSRRLSVPVPGIPIIDVLSPQLGSGRHLGVRVPVVLLPVFAPPLPVLLRRLFPYTSLVLLETQFVGRLEKEHTTHLHLAPLTFRAPTSDPSWM